MLGVLDQIIYRATEAAKVRPLRPLREWAESEIVIPDGPYKGERFRIRRQPFAGLLFDEIDSQRWPEVFVVGPSQTGKTLVGHVIPTLHRAAEWRRNVVLATPDMRIGGNKWAIDFLPVLEASPELSRLVPQAGPGSRGGAIKDNVRLQNGAVIKWMTAGGDDTQRAAFTAEGGVFVTEAARFSVSGESSVEADPLDQLRARMQAFPRRQRRLLVEGTATIEQELPWSAREQSSRSQIALPCPRCGSWVTLEREHLAGWREARTEHEAAELAHYACPDCGQPWTEEERAAANRDGKLLHGEQVITRDGAVSGEMPPTERLWFRWTMGNNLLLSAGDVAVDEWKAAQFAEDTDERDNAERKLCQFVWARPYNPKSLDSEPLTSHRVARHQSGLPMGMAPADTQYVTVGVDLGKWMGHFAAIAWRAGGLADVISYGVFDVPTRRTEGDTDSGFDELVAIDKALAKLRDDLESVGWVRHGSGEVLLPDRVLIDTGYQGDIVKAFCRRHSTDGQFGRASEVYVCCRGAGVGQHLTRKYQHPTRKGNAVVGIGERYYIARHSTDRCHVVELDTDHWKAWVHSRLHAPAGQPGCMTLFAAPEKHHNTFAKHITNEEAIQKPIPGHGLVTVWTNKTRKPNHFFDALVYACVGGSLCGWRIMESEAASAATNIAPLEVAAGDLRTMDGRDFYAMPGD